MRRELKYIHAADVHLDSPLQGLERYEGAPVDLIRGATRRALENLVQLAIRERVDFVIIAGDLYDGDWRDFNTGMYFVRQMAKMREAGIRVYLIAGNHDAASTMTRKLRLPENPEGDSLMLSHEMSETRRLDDLGVAIHGRSFANQAETKNMVPEYPALVPHFFNVGLLHTSLNGSDEHDTYAPCTETDLRSKGYDYWALGHIHKRTCLPSEGNPLKAPPILYSGNIQGRHVREPGARGCFLVTVHEGHETKIEFRSLDVFRWEICQVPCTDAKDTDEVVERFREVLKGLIQRHDGLPLGIRVILEGATKAHQELTSQREAVTAEIRSQATIVSDGQAWIEQVRLSTRYPRDQQIMAGGDGPLEELVNYLDELSSDSTAIEKLSDELKDLARKLPTEVTQGAEGLQLDQVEWLRNVVRDLKPLLLQRLKG